MALFTVHAPRMADGVEADPAELVFVKDGFCWPALFIPLVWLIYRGLWLTLLLYVVALVGLSFVAGLAGSDASSAVIVLFAFWFALEANGLRRWTLERHRYDLVGVVEGRTREEAERRYFAEAMIDGATAAPAAAITPPSAAPIPSAPPAPKRNPGIVGLFPDPRGTR
jgi:hypothetical protein